MNKLLVRFGLAILLFLIFLQYTRTTLDPDLGWHLRVGGQILDTGSAQRFDTFSFTMPGYKWVDHEWLTNAALAFLERHNIWWVAILIFTLLASVPLLVWLYRTRTAGEILLVFLATALLLSYAGVRAHLITFFFVFVVLEILMARRFLWALPFGFALAANLHAGFFVALVAVGVFTVLRPFSLKNWTVLGLSTAATFLNPYGWRLYEEIFRVTTSPMYAAYIAEWQPAFVHSALKGSLPGSLSVFLAIILITGLFVVLAWRYRKQYSAPVLAVAALFFLGYMKSLKNGPMFLASAMPIFFQGFEFLRQEVRQARRDFPITARESNLVRYLQAGAVIFLAVFVGASFFRGDGPRYPVGAVQFLQAQDPEKIGRLFNDYGWGGYLIWHLPEVEVFIDGRMPPWEDESGYSAMREYAAVFYPHKGENSQWEEVFKRHRIRTVLINVPECHFPKFSPGARFFWQFRQEIGQIPCQIAQGLEEQGWQAIYQDNTAIVLHKM